VRRFCCQLIAALLAGSIATAAHANDGASGGFQLSLTVPEVCDVDVNGSLVVEESGMAVLEVSEFCNSRRGFQGVASHRVLEPAEQVRINYGGQINELDKSGVSSIAFRQGPSLRTVPVTVQSAGVAAPLVISLGLLAI